jgi:hypothetical protein
MLIPVRNICLPAEPAEEVRAAVYQLADERMKFGVQDFSASLGGTNEKAFHVVQVLSVAVELLVWAVQGEAGESRTSCIVRIDQ